MIFLDLLLAVLVLSLLALGIWFWWRLRRVSRLLEALASALDRTQDAAERTPWIR